MNQNWRRRNRDGVFCRRCLRRFNPGERRLLFKYRPFQNEGVFAEAGPIYIHDRGWAFSSDSGYLLNHLHITPRVGLRADITSGDRNPQDNVLQTFNLLFPGTTYSDKIGLIGAPNSIGLFPNLRKEQSDDDNWLGLLLAREHARRNL